MSYFMEAQPLSILPCRLSSEQRARLCELETTIEHSFVSFLQCGRALLAVRDEKLYVEHYRSFEYYCIRRWGLTAHRGRELIRSTLVAETLLTGPAAPGGDAPLPENLSEQALRPLAKVGSPELQSAVWSLASRITEKPTHFVISRLVRTIQTAISEGYGDSNTSRPKRQESENTIFLRVVYKVSAMKSVSPQLIVRTISDPAQARRCVAACRELARRCHFIADELIGKFPGLS